MSSTPKSTGKQTAGAFDIRNIIGIVIGIYGVILLVMGLFFTSQAQLDKSGGLHANAIAGIVMLAVAAIFFTWSHARPVVVAVTEPVADPAVVLVGTARSADATAD
jgi:glucose uptake protein GlcU